MMQIKAGGTIFRWWQGCPFPTIKGIVSSIFSDGDEAILLMELIHQWRNEVHSDLIATDWNTQGESHAG